jgi:hypothetical protein
LLDCATSRTVQVAPGLRGGTTESSAAGGLSTPSRQRVEPLKLAFHFVPFPREIWEKPIALTGQEFKLLGWFLCDLKLGITAARYTDKEILTGCNRRAGVGLSRNALKSARESLVQKEFLEASEDASGLWSYRLLVSITDTENSDSVSITDTAIKEVRIKKKEENIYAPSDFFLTSSEETDPNNGSIQGIFQYYVEQTGKSRAYTLTPKRRKMGLARLKDAQGKVNGKPGAAVELMKLAIDAICQSDYHMKRGDYEKRNGPEYNDWENIFRSQEMFEKWLEASA